MKIKGFWYDSLLLSVIFAVSAGFAAVTAVKYNRGSLAVAEAIAILCLLIFTLFRVLTNKRRYNRMLRKAARKLDVSNTNVLSDMSCPVAVCDKNGFITWCNECFKKEISGGDIVQSTSISRFLPDDGDAPGACVRAQGKYYLFKTRQFRSDSDLYTVYSFFDNTYLKETEIKYEESRPYTVLFEIDNIDDSRSSFRDSERTEIKGRIEAMIDEWCEKYDSFIKSIGDDRYISVTEKKNIDAMVADKFSIVEKVRKYDYKGKNAEVTVSAGIASGDELKKCERDARKALDMALGRGGDQIALKTDDGYEFFGGVSKSAEKKYKSDVRIWGKKLVEEISDCSNVIICGHSYSDFDAIGGAAGILFAAKALKKPAYIAVNKNKTLAGNLIERLEKSGADDAFISPETALELVNRKTLLVVVDTNIPSFSECPALFEKIERKIVIDHHRFAQGTDETSAYFMHNAGASSVCEMITEILQYAVPDDRLPAEYAEALLAGIMLDTKNFIVRSGVRTFEAAAFLKDRDADTVAVKKLFSTPIEVTREKNETILNAHIHGENIISRVKNNVMNARLVAAQAADEMLGTGDVSASFVLFEEGGNTCISARSLGEVNVQIIMESMGGGGHRTMAACRLADVDMDTAEEMLIRELTEKENI